MGIHLFKHNQEAYDKVAAMLEEKGMAAVIHPTGTGKSMIAFKLVEEHEAERFLWLSPSEYIYQTQLENLKQTFPNIQYYSYSRLMKNEDRINKLFKELVPDTGKADSLAGELVRAMSRIGYRFYNDGDQLGIGYGKETCNPAGRFLGVKGNDKIAKLTADAWAVYSEEAYEKVLDILCGAVADYVEQNPDLRNQPTEDMWDFKDEEEDQDDSWDEEEDDWDEEEDYEDDEDY